LLQENNMESALGITMTAHNPLPPASFDEFGRRSKDFVTQFVDGFLMRYLPDLSGATIGFVIQFDNKVSLMHPDGGLEEVIKPETGNRIMDGLGPTALFHTGIYAVLWWLRANRYPPQWLPKRINVRTDLATDTPGMTGTTWTFHLTTHDEPGFMDGARYAQNVPCAYVHLAGKDTLRPHSEIDLRTPDTEIIHQTGTVGAVEGLCARFRITPEQYFWKARDLMQAFLTLPEGYRLIVVNNHGEECVELGVGIKKPENSVEQ
jgi:hypothetical protein